MSEHIVMALEVAQSFIHDLRDVDTMTIGEVVDRDLTDEQIEGVRAEIEWLTGYLTEAARAAVTGRIESTEAVSRG